MYDLKTRTLGLVEFTLTYMCMEEAVNISSFSCLLLLSNLSVHCMPRKYVLFVYAGAHEKSLGSRKLRGVWVETLADILNELTSDVQSDIIIDHLY